MVVFLLVVGLNCHHNIVMRVDEYVCRNTNKKGTTNLCQCLCTSLGSEGYRMLPDQHHQSQQTLLLLGYFWHEQCGGGRRLSQDGSIRHESSSAFEPGLFFCDG